MNGVNNLNQIGQQPKNFVCILGKQSGDLAWQLSKEGHLVKVYIKAKEDADVYNGFVEKVDSGRSYKDWADIIIFDDVEFGEIADKLRKNGKLIIGGSVYTDKLEMDRGIRPDGNEKTRHQYFCPSGNFPITTKPLNLSKTTPTVMCLNPAAMCLPAAKGFRF